MCMWHPIDAAVVLPPRLQQLDAEPLPLEIIGCFNSLYV